MSRCSVQGLCRLAGISRQAYYQGRKQRQREHFEEELVVGLVRRQRAQHPRIGARKLLVMLEGDLAKAGVALGRDRFFELLGRHGLLVEPKRRRARTTYSDHALPLYRNLLYEREATAAHQVWVADITYLETATGFVYLSLISDLVSRQIVGWHLGESLEAAETLKALQMALAQLPPNCWPIHHSDRGSQYCCHQYVSVLREHGLSISMTEANHCYENATAERLNGILKNEYHLDLRFRNKAQALAATAQAIELYNHHRPHLSLGMRCPAQVHAQAA